MKKSKGFRKNQREETSSVSTAPNLSESVFTTSVEFERTETPEEKAQKMGLLANTGNLMVLTMFGAASGILLLLISLYLSHVEAMNAAKIIGRDSQYWISLGLSSASAIFSVIGFQQFARWIKYRSIGRTLPVLVEASWTKDPARETLYKIMIHVIDEGRSGAGVLSLIFIFANFVCSAITLWAIISALPEDADTSIWIYTLAISGLAFISGACISLLTSADINEASVISTAQAKYRAYADAQAASDMVVSGKK